MTDQTTPTAHVVEDTLRNLMAEGVVHIGPAERGEGFAEPLAAIDVELAPAGGGPVEKVRIEVGAGEVWRETSVFYVRKKGLDATFAFAQSRLRPLLELF